MVRTCRREDATSKNIVRFLDGFRAVIGLNNCARLTVPGLPFSLTPWFTPRYMFEVDIDNTSKPRCARNIISLYRSIARTNESPPELTAEDPIDFEKEEFFETTIA